MVGLNKIGFGGGCHWCTEGVFQSLVGVHHVDQGWIASVGQHKTFAEAVVVTFDANLISLAVLIEIHLLTHSSEVNHSMRDKYRSAVYFFTKEQGRKASKVLENLNTKSINPIVTKAIPFGTFKLNKEDFLNYYKTRPDAPFCTTFIEPKITRLLKTHQQYVDPKRLSKSLKT